MNKFDLHNYFFLKEALENEEENNPNNAQSTGPGVPVPGQAPVKNSQNAEQGGQNNVPPQSQDAILKQQNSQNSNVFSNFVGSTISDIAFKKTGANGGELSISISKSNMPLKISWVGDKVTVTQPNGNIVSL